MSMRWVMASAHGLIPPAWLDGEAGGLYRKIVETTSEGIATVDAEHRITFVNGAMAAMLGYEPQEILGKTIFDFLDRSQVAAAERSTVLRRESMDEQLELRLCARDGRAVFALLETSALLAPDGSYAGGLAMVTDITERRRAEAERSRLAAIVSSASLAIIGADGDDVIGTWNEASSRLYGYSEAEALGHVACELLALDVDGRRAMVRRAAAGEHLDEVDTIDVGKGGEQISVSLTLAPVCDSVGTVIGVSRIARDLRAAKLLEGEVRRLGDHDWLTGLYNRQRLKRELDEHLDRARRTRQNGVLLSFDVDNFKLINDGQGHDTGDRTLRAVAQVLRARAGETNIVARLGGDEFAVVLTEANEAQARTFAGEIRSLLCERTVGPPIFVSIGVRVLECDEEIAASDVLAAADIAQFEAKRRGGDQAVVFDLHSAGTISWVERIRTALAEDRFVLFGQPIVDLRDDRVALYEILLRMRSEGGELIAPGKFLPAAERFGLIGEVDRWVTRRGLALARAGTPVSINLAGPTIGDEGVLSLVVAEIAAGLDPAKVIFELTETAAVSGFARAEQFLGRLAGIGCGLALDDFGTGFASFTYLKYLRAGYLKIDAEFVGDVTSNATDQKVVAAVVDIAHSMGKKTIAEGVEDAEVLGAVRALGVDYAQGFHLGRPVPIEECIAARARAEAAAAPGG